MRAMRFLIVLALSISAAALVAPWPGALAQERYKVRLTTVPMDGGMRGTVAGSGAASATISGTKFAIDGTFAGLLSPATTARLFRGPARGVRGSAIGDLTVSKSTSGTLTGTVDLTADLVRDLREGRLYVQISSEKAPDGNLWGWILK